MVLDRIKGRLWPQKNESQFNQAEIDAEVLEQIEVGNVRLLNAMIAACLLILVWAALAPLDVISMATGVVQPDSKVQKIHHLEGGILRTLHVKEGNFVKRGQLLVTLSSTQYAADASEMSARLDSLQADFWRLEAESSNRSILAIPEDFKNKHPELAERTLSLFKARRESLQQTINVQEREISAKEAELSEIVSRLSNTRDRYRLAFEQSQIGERLLARQLSNRYEQIDREKEVVALKSRIEEDQAASHRLKLLVAKARNELSGLRSRHEGEVRKELSDVRRQLAENTSHNDRLMDSLARTELTAPAGGVVKSLYFTNPGAVIPPGGEVLDLVPEDDHLIIEAHLPLQDIGFVALGQTAIVQLASSDATRFGRLEGKVQFISPDSISPKEGVAFYNVKIALQSPHFGKGSDTYLLVPGVPVTVGIVTGSRTVLEYFLYPMIRTLPFSLSER